VWGVGPAKIIMPPVNALPAEGEEDCEVCKKAKKKSAAFQALMRAKGISIPVAGYSKPTTTDTNAAAAGAAGARAQAALPVPVDCLSHTSSGAGGHAAQDTVGCPADRESLGRAGWTVLHTMAAYFPREPTYAQQASMGVFLRLFGSFYPCRECREDFQHNLRSEPPPTDSRASLMGWMCRAHNRVNARLGKPIFDCSLGKLEERWRDGHPACDADAFFAENEGEGQASS
jgi:hypothetical protein